MLILPFAAGLTASLLFIFWFISYCYCISMPVRCGSHLYSFDFSVGCIWIYDYKITSPGPLDDPRAHFHSFFFEDEAGWRALPSVETSSSPNRAPARGDNLDYRWTLILPLYPFFLGLGAPVAVAFFKHRRRLRRVRDLCCGECGYELSGTLDCCPECGTPVPA